MFQLVAELFLSSVKWGDDKDESVKVSVDYVEGEDALDGQPYLSFTIGEFFCEVIGSPDAPLPLLEDVVSFFAFISDNHIFFVFVDNIGCVYVCSSENIIMLSCEHFFPCALLSEQISFDQFTGTLSFFMGGSTPISEWKLSDGRFQ